MEPRFNPRAGGSLLSSPDAPSAVYPDRLIRPLPRRTLRSRLSEEAAESISFPPNVPSTRLPTCSGYSESGDYTNDSKVLIQQNGDVFGLDHDPECDHYDIDHDEDHCPYHQHHCHHNDDELDSGEDRSPAAVRRTNGYRSSPRSPRSSRHNRYGSHSKISPSAPDGYDAFENTNNKKKRKIPTSGSLSLHHSSLAQDMAHLGLGSRDGGLDESQYYGSGSGLGVQGAGRGRSSRKVSGRTPLGAPINGSNARTVAPRLESASSFGNEEDTKSDQGIISAAIANATALLRKPLGKGQENVGVLDQQAKSPTSSQFTFTCETDSKGVKFPEQSLYSPTYQQRANAMPAPTHPSGQKGHIQSNQTTPALPLNSQPATASQHANANQNSANAPATAQGKKPRRRRGDIYALAARQRRLQQEYANLHHPPVPEDVWICEFCEYESIFGVQPTALIRQYEVKDRRERRRLAEKRRLLEKAKMKGRKGKKATKGQAKAAAAAASAANTNHASNASSGHHGNHLDPQHDDEYADDGLYDDDGQPLDQLGPDEYLDDDDYEDDLPLPPLEPIPSAGKQPPMPGGFDSVGREKGGVIR